MKSTTLNIRWLRVGLTCSILGLMTARSSAGMVIEEMDSGSSDKILPKVISQTAAVYPASAKKLGLHDKVVEVSFTVDVEGRVKELDIVNSPSKELNASAIAAVANWRFSPGLRDGKPAEFRLKTAVEFTTEALNTRQPAVAYASGSYDVEPATKRKIAPVYPYDMIVQGRSGWAETKFLIDYTGRALFTCPSGASDEDFARAVIAMVEASEFTPAQKDNRTVMAPAVEHYTFNGEAALDAEARRVLNELRKPAPAIVSATELDDRPKVVRQSSPVYPRALKSDGVTGQAEIEFVIDREGRVLFPRIVSATHQDFGWAAATAVAQWKFKAPEKNGEKVDARMVVPVIFDARQLAAAD